MYAHVFVVASQCQSRGFPSRFEAFSSPSHPLFAGYSRPPLPLPLPRLLLPCFPESNMLHTFTKHSFGMTAATPTHHPQDCHKIDLQRQGNVSYRLPWAPRRIVTRIFVLVVVVLILWRRSCLQQATGRHRPTRKKVDHTAEAVARQTKLNVFTKRKQAALARSCKAQQQRDNAHPTCWH